MKTLIVPQKGNGKKLNTYLLENLEGLTTNLFYKTLRKKDIRINGKRVTQNITLQKGDTIEVYLSDSLLMNMQKDIPIIYEDENILIVNKPKAIEVTGEHSLTSLLKEQGHCPTLTACHRLDRNTTGLVLFAKHQVAFEILFKKFKNHEIEKHYVCHVYGIPNQKHKNLIAYLFKDAKKSQVYLCDTPKLGYQKIETSYTLLESYSDNTCLLDIELLTGKTHQIRAHLAHIGHPIIGDGKYGKNEINKKYKAKNQRLCSCSLSFRFHSESGVLTYLNNKTFHIPYSF